MEGKIYDAAVIGAGIEGSSTAYNLAKNGYDTLLLEQFSLPHTRGSSHGQSRIIRKAYTEEHFARMMPESYDRWAVLERETGKSLFLSTGMLAYGRGSVPREKKAMDSTEHALKQVNCNYEKMNASELRKKFKGFRFQDDHIGLLDKEAGLLRAHPALDAFQEMFRKFGGTLKDDMKVTSILPAEVVTLRTNTGATFRTRRLVIAAGPWTQRLIEPLGIYVPLNPIRVTVCYWRQKADVCSVKSGFPAFINNGNIQGPDGCGYHVYGIPAHEYENLTKVGKKSSLHFVFASLIQSPLLIQQLTCMIDLDLLHCRLPSGNISSQSVLDNIDCYDKCIRQQFQDSWDQHRNH